MASNKQYLRTFMRLDGNGKTIAGSLIQRKNKPKVGKWLEVRTYECCDSIFDQSTTTTTTTTEGA